MVRAESSTQPYQIVLTAGHHSLTADATIDKGGNGAGFRPHELLEGALAACSAMMIRMVAAKDNMPLEGVNISVEIDRTHADETIFRSQIELHGDLNDAQRQKLLAAAQACPVKKTLSQKISFIVSAPNAR